MYDFACEDLAVTGGAEKHEFYLKIDFDSFKVFKTDAEVNTMSPEWCFKAGFQYWMNFLEKLDKRMLQIQCINRRGDQVVGQASIDLRTIACGPPYFRLTLFDAVTQEPRGILKFICVVKMCSPDFAVVLKNLRLTMQGCPASARLNISTTLADTEVTAAHSPTGVWDGIFVLTFSSTLGDLLKAPSYEYLQFTVVDEMGVKQGEARLAFRSAFSTQEQVEIPFSIDVTYSCLVQGEESPDTLGNVGAIEGILFYQNLPSYAQMVGGLCVDGQIEGGYWLIQDLPFPASLSQPPPLWQDPTNNGGIEFFGDHQQPDEQSESKLDDIDDKKLFEALELIDLPPPWEKRRERGGNGGGRMYFADPRSRRTTWKDPRFMPENWDQRIDAVTGKVHFLYHKTRQSTYMDPRGCPHGWDMRLSKNGDVYFAFLPAMQTTFTDPRGLPEHFDAALDDLGRMYFKNHVTKETAWQDPREGQQEVQLTQWRQAQMTRWLKEQVLAELEEMKQNNSNPYSGENDDQEHGLN